MSRLYRNEPETEITETAGEYFNKFLSAVITGVGMGLGFYLIYKAGLVSK